jgi:hypothetical protein
MPQYLWEIRSCLVRVCEACTQFQIRPASDSNYWIPAIKPICPGDPDDGGRLTRPQPPIKPRSAPKVREDVSA